MTWRRRLAGREREAVAPVAPPRPSPGGRGGAPWRRRSTPPRPSSRRRPSVWPERPGRRSSFACRGPFRDRATPGYASCLSMRLAAAFLLLSLLAAFHAPLVAAVSDSGMDCCAGGMTEMCCPLAGACTMRSCGGNEREALLSTMGVFLIPGPAAALLPASSSLASPVEESSPVSRAPRILDPPPRG